MDVNSIFNLFEEQKPKTTSKRKKKEDKVDIKQHPIYWIGMFKKTLDNKNILRKNILNVLGNEKENIDLLTDILINNNAWSYISKIDVNNLFHQEILYSTCTKALLERVNQSIEFFSSIEEYEKCSYLQTIQNFLKLLLN